MSAIEKNESNVVSLVKSHAEFIKREITEANQAFGKSLEHYRNAGERLALVRDEFKGKPKLKGSGFAAWVESNCDMKKTQSYSYIAVYENWDAIVQSTERSTDIFTLVDALKAIKDIKANTLQAQDDSIDVVATEVLDGLNAEKLAIKKQAEVDRKRAEKAEKELVNRNQDQLALTASVQEAKQLKDMLAEMQRQLTEAQNKKPEVQQITVIDDSATKELEKLKKELEEKNKQLSSVAKSRPTEVVKEVVKEVFPDDYEELKIDALQYRRQTDTRLRSRRTVDRFKDSIRDIDMALKQLFVESALVSDEEYKIGQQIKEIIRPYI